jgi:SAM-dependent methyltransferase/uncharacterized protein YbaR (Trm112 family)
MAEAALPSRFQEFQEILFCPRTKGALSLITAVELSERLPRDERARVPDGTTAAFVSENSLTAYPIIGRIVDFLDQDCLRLSEDHGGNIPVAADDGSILRSVKRWYDEFGWQLNDRGIYNDTAMFSQLSSTAHGFYELSSHLELLNRLPGGKFILDAASGPIAHPEKLAYSWFYKYHVCVDISLTALREADSKLGARGFCCMADICHLPFRDGVFDGAVSGYTVQHIESSRQSTAVAELYRVLGPGAHLCLLSQINSTRTHHALVRTLKGIRKVLTPLGNHASQKRAPNPVSSSAAPPHGLYFHGRDLAWWRKVASGLTDSYSVEGIRVFGKEEFETLFGNSRRAAEAVRALEALFPKIAARLCAYMLLDLSKTK